MKPVLKSKKPFSLKLLGKKILKGLAAVGIFVATTLTFASCGPSNPTPTPTPTPTPIVETYNNLQDVINKDSSIVSNLVADGFNSVLNQTGHAKKDVIYAAADVNEQAKSLGTVEYTFAVKTGDTTRTYYEVAVNANNSLTDLAEGKVAAINVNDNNTTFKTTTNYDAKEKQNDETFLNSLFGVKHDYTYTNYEKEIFPEVPPVVTYETIGDLKKEYGAQIQNLVVSTFDAVLQKLDVSKDDLIYASADIDETATKFDKFNYAIAINVGGTARAYYELTLDFTDEALEKMVNGELNSIAVKAKDITITRNENYDAVEKQNDTAYLNGLYGVDRDYVIEAFKEQAQTTTYQNLGEVLTAKGAQVKAVAENLIDTTLTLQNIDKENVIYLAYDFNENATTFNTVGVTVAYKTGETERTYADYFISFNDVALDKLADNSCSISVNANSIQDKIAVTYDAKAKQNDADYLSGLYDGTHDVVKTSYVNEHFEEDHKEIKNVADLIANYASEVETALNTHYEGVLKKAFRTEYGKTRYEVQSHAWDLGEVVNGKVQNLKLTLEYYDNTTQNTYLKVYTVALDNGVALSDMIDASKVPTKATYTQAFSYGYIAANQHDRNALMAKIAEVAVTDGFEYSVDDILYTNNGAATDATLGSTQEFTVVVSNKNGIRQIKIAVATANSDQNLIAAINAGKYKVIDYSASADYTNEMPVIANTTENENA